MASILARYKLVFHVPPAALEACKTAIFAAGAGRYPGAGNYTECCFTVFGTGQFRPGDAANPHIGKVGELEHVEEARVETLCVGEEVARRAVVALKKCVSALFCCRCFGANLGDAGHIRTRNLLMRCTSLKTFDGCHITIVSVYGKPVRQPCGKRCVVHHSLATAESLITN